jgi:hypothetical protein
MSENDRQARSDLAFDDVEIRPTDAARIDLDNDLSCSGSRIRQLRGAERISLGRPGSLEEHRLHGALFSDGMRVA